MDPLRDYRIGERLAAATVNAHSRFQKRGVQSGPPPAPSVLNTTVVLMRNDGASSEDDVPRFGILGIDDIVIDRDNNEAQFDNVILLSGVTPDSASSSSEGHTGKFGIAQQPIAIGDIGRVVISGATQCMINVTKEEHRFADIKPGDNTQLQSRTFGSAKILWKESGTGESKWAVVDLGHGIGPVLVKRTTAAAGGGMYNGRMWLPGDGDISASGNLSADDLGLDPGSDDCLILNLEEVGKATHDLTAGSSQVQFFNATFLQFNSDGMPVFTIGGGDWEDCT